MYNYQYISSSPELKAQVSFFDQFSFNSPSVCQAINIHTFNFLRTIELIKTGFGTLKHVLVKSIQICAIAEFQVSINTF